MKSIYLDTLKHILNFYEIERESLEHSKEVRYVPAHYESEMNNEQFNAYDKSYKLAVSRRVITYRSGSLIKGRENERSLPYPIYLSVDHARLTDELLTNGQTDFVKSQKTRVELKLEDRTLFMIMGGEKIEIKSNFRKGLAPYKLMDLLIHKKPGIRVDLASLKESGIEVKNMVEGLRQAGLEGDLKQIFCPGRSKEAVTLEPAQFIDNTVAKAIKAKYEVKRD